MAVPKVAEASTLQTSGTEARDAVQPTAPGFRHFLRTPLPSQRFRVFGIDPLESPALQPRLRGLMHRLSRRMDAEIYWPQHDDEAAEHWENPRIPSGYTYLLQFVAHDLVHSAIPLSVAGTLGAGKADDSLARMDELRAETLFVWGRQDPHVPFAGRQAIRARLEEVNARYEWHEVNAAHAFLRDEGPRYDPALFLQAIGWMLAMFERTLRR